MSDPTFSSLILNANTVAFDQNTAATHTIFTPDPGERFIVFRLFLVITATQTIQFQSAANNLTGVMDFTISSGDECYMSWGESGETYVLKGAATGEAFNVVLGQAQQVSGWANIGTMDQ